MCNNFVEGETLFIEYIYCNSKLKGFSDFLKFLIEIINTGSEQTINFKVRTLRNLLGAPLNAVCYIYSTFLC